MTIERSGNELWKSDGMETGTVLIKDINANTSSSSPNQMVGLDEEFFSRQMMG